MNYRYKILWKFPRLTIIIFLLFYTINPTSAQTTLPAEDIAEKALAATVYLEMKDSNDKTLGIGSGFFVKTNIIATNYHVIEGAAKGTAKLVGKSRTYNIEGVTAIDRENDLALLKVTASGIRPLSLGDSDKVRIGETVYVAGNPKGLEGTFSDGIISSRRDGLTKERLQMTAPISPGSSGGPLLNKKGEVIGVSFAGHRALYAQNLNFAIPSKYLKKLLEQGKPAKPLSQGKHTISAETYFQWGYTKSKLGDYAGAISDYSRAIQLQPDAVNAYGNRGAMKALLGQHAAAIADYNIVVRLEPDNIGAYLARGLAKQDLKQHFAAITDFDTAIRIKPEEASAYLLRGISKSELGQHSAAIADYDMAIHLEPDNAAIYVSRGGAKVELERYFSAIADYDIAIRLKPNYAKAYLGRGLVKGVLEQKIAAISDFNTAIRLNPNYAEAYFTRGLTKASLDQKYQKLAAISDFDKAIRLKSDYTEAYFRRGLIKLVLGRTREANQDFRTALRHVDQASDEDLKVQIEVFLKLTGK